jgi:predicted alpha/beta-hydrolase family hydrolase
VPILVEQFRSVAREAAAAAGRPVIIGGKSMGGRVASMIADDLFAYGIVAGCVCLGYPFHPPRKPDVLRIAHLAAMACPLLIVQGERDALGSRSEVASYPIDPRIAFEWLPDGDHDLAPRRASGYTPAGHIATAAAAVAAFGTRIDPIRSSKGAVPIAAMPDRR